jgi:hypothetical protein
MCMCKYKFEHEFESDSKLTIYSTQFISSSQAWIIPIFTNKYIYKNQ